MTDEFAPQRSEDPERDGSAPTSAGLAGQPPQPQPQSLPLPQQSAGSGAGPVLFQPMEPTSGSPWVTSQAAERDGEPVGLGPLAAADSGASGQDGQADEKGQGQDGLARMDPLSIHPRMSSRILCLVFALVCFALAAGVYWLGVRTMDGQSYDDMVWSGLKETLPSWVTALVGFLSVSTTQLSGWPIVAISIALGLISTLVIVVRKRWWLLGQMAAFGVLCFAAACLKLVLPRSQIIYVASTAKNSAPSGHTILATAASIMLLCAVPRVWRAAMALVAGLYSSLVAFSLVAGQWHRPSDVVMSMLLVTGLALLVLVFTRGSGMDRPGERVSSASIQIVSSILITGGIMLSLYGSYVIWQVQPGLGMSTQWAREGAVDSALIIIAALATLGPGLVLAMRQLTASPLSKLGLVGAPPAPPVTVG
ncbi:hypothetical protein CRD60_05665 [Bifidobacterium aemilianum]|uniref:Phosphatidic acid phosphatase type 2/haloperoxidase domain-containing protein n=1 Tax=Bifidobacterium aemilianum TaxID=2493120 RepID=A0A366K7S2_9BIFI|nr:phosphatase PAP2 family protein [Bifidobacterium aemilianum]RBP97719.1 hypothetical protein CRD60_05665 [Bifidobacterium aemilianum]